MRAYRCDACQKMFMLPDNDLGVCQVPGNLYIYRPHGMSISFDLCKDCLEKVVLTIERISGNAEMAKTMDLFYRDEVNE